MSRKLLFCLLMSIAAHAVAIGLLPSLTGPGDSITSHLQTQMPMRLMPQPAASPQSETIRPSTDDAQGRDLRRAQAAQHRQTTLRAAPDLSGERIDHEPTLLQGHAGGIGNDTELTTPPASEPASGSGPALTPALTPPPSFKNPFRPAALPVVTTAPSLPLAAELLAQSTASSDAPATGCPPPTQDDQTPLHHACADAASPPVIADFSRR